jgi:(p)ppGpp synthase/HD superfamily hydrolase
LSTLERAIAIAAKAHEGQVDKSGAPYILHPLRVMLRLSTTDERITAVLHDVIEDCGVSLESLRAEGFSEAVIAAIDAVTKRPEEEDDGYQAFVLRAASNAIGRRVKLADLEDNTNLSRIPNPADKDRQRAAKYQRALAAIRALEDGNAAGAPRVRQAPG